MPVGLPFVARRRVVCGFAAAQPPRVSEPQCDANAGHPTEAGACYGCRMRDALYVLGGIAIVAFVVVRQRRSERFVERSLVFPVVLGVYGLVLARGAVKSDPVTAASVVLLSLSAGASIGFGVFRGRTIELFVRNGELWERASWTTIVAGWGGLVLTRVILIGLAAVIGATLAASPTWIPLLLAVTLAAQILVEAERARATGATLGESRRARRRSRRRDTG